MSPIFSPTGSANTWQCVYTLSTDASVSESGTYFCSAGIEGETEDSNDLELIVYCKFSFR